MRLEDWWEAMSKAIRAKGWGFVQMHAHGHRRERVTIMASSAGGSGYAVSYPQESVSDCTDRELEGMAGRWPEAPAG